MPSAKRRMQLVAAFTGLLCLAGAGCHGFFVNPTLTSIAVTPASPTVVVGTTRQLTAIGTYDDGSTQNLTASATWASSNSAIASVDNVTTKGLVTGVATSATPVTITATSGTVSGSTNVTVSAAALVSIAISSVPGPNPTVAAGGTVQFTAIGTYASGPTQDITNSVTWNSDNTIVTFNTTGLATVSSTATSGQKANITAVSGAITSNTATITVQ